MVPQLLFLAVIKFFQHVSHESCGASQDLGEVSVFATQHGRDGHSNPRAGWRAIILHQHNVVRIHSWYESFLTLSHPNNVGSLLLSQNGDKNFVTNGSHAAFVVDVNALGRLARQLGLPPQLGVVHDSQSRQLPDLRVHR